MESPKTCERCGGVPEFAVPIGGGWMYACRPCRDATIASTDDDHLDADDFYPLEQIEEERKTREAEEKRQFDEDGDPDADRDAAFDREEEAS